MCRLLPVRELTQEEGIVFCRLASSWLSSGAIKLYSGTVSNVTVSSGGVEYVYSGGVTYSNTVSSGGVQSVYFSGVASATILGGQETVVSGGKTVSTTINSGGLETVSVGATASATTVKSGGIEWCIPAVPPVAPRSAAVEL